MELSLFSRSKAISSKTIITALCVALLVGAPALAQQPATKAPPATMTARQQEWLSATSNERVRLAEKLGEEGACANAAKKGYEPILTKADKSLPQGFD